MARNHVRQETQVRLLTRKRVFDEDRSQGPMGCVFRLQAITALSPRILHACESVGVHGDPRFTWASILFCQLGGMAIRVSRGIGLMKVTIVNSALLRAPQLNAYGTSGSFRNSPTCLVHPRVRQLRRSPDIDRTDVIQKITHTHIRSINLARAWLQDRHT